MESDPDPHEIKANRKTELWMRIHFLQIRPQSCCRAPPPFLMEADPYFNCCAATKLMRKNFSRNFVPVPVLNPTGTSFYCSSHEIFRWRFIIFWRIFPNFYSKFIQDSKCKANVISLKQKNIKYCLRKRYFPPQKRLTFAYTKIRLTNEFLEVKFRNNKEISRKIIKNNERMYLNFFSLCNSKCREKIIAFA
jgi:hypothetical protein